MIFTTDHMQKKLKIKKKPNASFDVGNINLGEIRICFIVIMVVACDMVSFGVEFQSDNVNDGSVSDG